MSETVLNSLLNETQISNLLAPLPFFSGSSAEECRIWCDYLDFIHNNLTEDNKLLRSKQAALQRSSSDCLTFIYKLMDTQLTDYRIILSYIQSCSNNFNSSFEKYQNSLWQCNQVCASSK